MNKRRVFVLFFVLFLLASVFSIVFVGAATGGLESTAENIEGKAEDAEEKIEKAEKIADDLGKQKWDYLGEEWKKIFLSNKYVAGINGFLESISIVFFIFLASHYSLSIGFLILIAIWIFFLVKFYQILRDFSMFSEGTSFMAGFALTVALGHIGLYVQIIQGLEWLFLWQEAWWVRSLIMLGIILLFIIFSTVSKILGKWYQQEKEKDEKETERMNRKFLQRFTDAVRNGLSGE